MNLDDDNEVMNLWNELKVTVDVLELDVVKNAYGNRAAGVRARKGLREIKRLAHRLIVMTKNIDTGQFVPQNRVRDKDG